MNLFVENGADSRPIGDSFARIVEQLGNARLLVRRQRHGRRRHRRLFASPAPREKRDAPPPSTTANGASQSSSVCQLSAAAAARTRRSARPENRSPDCRCRPRQPLAHQHAQILGERRIGIVDRLVLADHAAQLLGERAGARLERRVFQDFVGLDREGGSAEQATARERCRASGRRTALLRRLQRGLARGLRRADTQAAVGKRQRAAEHHHDAPNQISSTSGL